MFVLGQIMDWIYQQIIGFLGDFFSLMRNMGAELFGMTWLQAIVIFFSYLAWALYGTGLVVALFEFAIEAQSGRASVKDTALNAIKGFMAVNLFTIVPVELYKLSITLQGSFTSGISKLLGASGGISTMALGALAKIGGLGLHPILGIFCVILMGYAVIKVFFANLKRGGILLIQIAIGSRYMFSVPRGYIDGFVSWSKQVVGLCLTAFLQATILIFGLLRHHRLQPADLRSRRACLFYHQAEQYLGAVGSQRLSKNLCPDDSTERHGVLKVPLEFRGQQALPSNTHRTREQSYRL